MQSTTGRTGTVNGPVAAAQPPAGNCCESTSRPKNNAKSAGSRPVRASTPRPYCFRVFLLDREGELAFVRLAAYRVFHLHADRVLARVDRLLQIDTHGGGDIGLRIEGLGLFHGSLGLRPQHFSAGGD